MFFYPNKKENQYAKHPCVSLLDLRLIKTETQSQISSIIIIFYFRMLMRLDADDVLLKAMAEVQLVLMASIGGGEKNQIFWIDFHLKEQLSNFKNRIILKNSLLRTRMRGCT